MSSRKEEKEQRRQERLAQERGETDQAKRRRLYGIIVGSVLAGAALVAVVVVIAAGGGGDDGGGHGSTGNAQQSFPDAATVPAQNITELGAAARAAGCVLRNPSIEGSEHVPDKTKVEYKTSPPTSGSHNPVPAEDGYYATQPSPRNAVHALEHGRIYIQYKPTLSKQRIAQLGGLFNDDPFHMVLSPNADIPYQVAVTAWGHLAGCKKVTDETFDVLRAFRDRYRDRGPEAVP